jgi:hypothetical protein
VAINVGCIARSFIKVYNRNQKALSFLAIACVRDPVELLSDLLGKKLDVPLSSMHADPLSIWDEPGGALYAHDSWQAILPCDYCPMGHLASDFRDEATCRNEKG